MSHYQDDHQGDSRLILLQGSSETQLHKLYVAFPRAQDAAYSCSKDAVKPLLSLGRTSFGSSSAAQGVRHIRRTNTVNAVRAESISSAFCPCWIVITRMITLLKVQPKSGANELAGIWPCRPCSHLVMGNDKSGDAKPSRLPKAYCPSPDDRNSWDQVEHINAVAAPLHYIPSTFPT